MYKRIFIIFVLLAIMAIIGWITLPYVFPSLCKNKSPFIELSLRSCNNINDVPPILGMDTRWPDGYSTAIRLCEWPFYSKTTKLVAINSLVWYAVHNIEREKCIEEIQKMSKDPEYQLHCRNLFMVMGLRSN